MVNKKKLLKFFYIRINRFNRLIEKIENGEVSFPDLSMSKSIQIQWVEGRRNILEVILTDLRTQGQLDYFIKRSTKQERKKIKKYSFESMSQIDVNRETKSQYVLDLSKLTIDQMKGIIRIVNHSCGEDGFMPDCKLCEACELECAKRTGYPVEIARCG